MNKNEKIRETLQQTREKRKSQKCSVYTIKIQENKLSPEQLECLSMQFIEAKRLYNYILNWTLISEENNLYNFDTKIKSIFHKDKDMNDVEYELKYLGSQAKQSLLKYMISSTKTLSTLKRNGNKIGKLKFKSEINCIDLKQYGNSYKFYNSRNIKIQGIPGKIKVNGLSQILNSKNKIRKNIEFANAKLLKRSDGFYLAITTYKNIKNVQKQYKGEEIGIDFGCSTTITLSNGQKFNASIQETERLKRLQRKFSKQVKGSTNRWKTLLKIKKEYQKLTNKKNDLANKIAHEILQYENIYMQDENLTGWKIKFGKTVQHSVLGRLKSKVKPHAKFVLDRFEPTTKMCYNCGQVKEEINLNERVYCCDCGLPPEDRDIHAAKNMIILSKIRLGLGRTELTPVDIELDSNGALMNEAGRFYKESSKNFILEDAQSLVEH